MAERPSPDDEPYSNQTERMKGCSFSRPNPREWPNQLNCSCESSSTARRKKWETGSKEIIKITNYNNDKTTFRTKVRFTYGDSFFAVVWNTRTNVAFNLRFKPYFHLIFRDSNGHALWVSDWTQVSKTICGKVDFLSCDSSTGGTISPIPIPPDVLKHTNSVDTYHDTDAKNADAAMRQALKNLSDFDELQGKAWGVYQSVRDTWGEEVAKEMVAGALASEIEANQ